MKIPVFLSVALPTGAAPSLPSNIKLPAGIHQLPAGTKLPPAAVQKLTAAAQQAQAPLMIPTWFQQHLGWLTHTIAALGIIAAIALVVLLAMQTTKQEGLSGTIGGRVDSNYRGRPGAEEQLKRVTGLAAGVFIVAFVLLSITGI